jgi:hypothetical protein
MNALTVASDGSSTALAEAGFSAAFAVAVFCPAITPHISARIKVRLREERIYPFNSAIDIKSFCFLKLKAKS